MVDKSHSIACPECGATNSRVIQTMHEGAIFRYRRCENNHRYKSIEIPVAEYDAIKNSGNLLPDMGKVETAVTALVNRLKDVRIVQDTQPDGDNS